MRVRQVVMWAAAVMLLVGCLGDPDGVVFGGGDLDVGGDVASDIGSGDGGDNDGGEPDGGEPDAGERDAGESDGGEPDVCVPGEAGCGPEHCGNGQLDGDESDVDCGGSCPGCGAGELCASVDDCSADEVVELLRCERAGVEVCAPRGVGVYRVGELACEREDDGGGRCVVRYSENEERRVEDDAACEIDTEGVSCGQAREELGACLPGTGQACSERGTRTVTRYEPTCSAGSCQEVASTSQEDCTRTSAPEPGDVCGAGPWSAWSDCVPESGRDSCAAGGVQQRTRTVARCTTAGTCAPVSSEVDRETRACQRSPNPQLCSSTGANNSSFVCHQGQCCMPNCSDARRSCRQRVSDGCGGQCPRLTCDDASEGCGVDGQCRSLCSALTNNRTCQADTECEQMCACPLGAAPRCGALGCTCL